MAAVKHWALRNQRGSSKILTLRLFLSDYKRLSSFLFHQVFLFKLLEMYPTKLSMLPKISRPWVRRFGSTFQKCVACAHSDHRCGVWKDKVRAQPSEKADTHAKRSQQCSRLVCGAQSSCASVAEPQETKLKAGWPQGHIGFPCRNPRKWNNTGGGTSGAFLWNRDAFLHILPKI